MQKILDKSSLTPTDEVLIDHAWRIFEKIWPECRYDTEKCSIHFTRKSKYEGLDWSDDNDDEFAAACMPADYDNLREIYIWINFDENKKDIKGGKLSTNAVYNVGTLCHELTHAMQFIERRLILGSKGAWYRKTCNKYSAKNMYKHYSFYDERGEIDLDRYWQLPWEVEAIKIEEIARKIYYTKQSKHPSLFLKAHNVLKAA